MNESYFESIFAIFDEKSPFLSILDTFWTIFGHFSYSTSIKESLTIELNYLLNWISRIFFELNNILNWILGKAILNQILNESFFGKIQSLNWIRLSIDHTYGKEMWNFLPFLFIEIWLFDTQNTFHPIVMGLKNAFFMSFMLLLYRYLTILWQESSTRGELGILVVG